MGLAGLSKYLKKVFTRREDWNALIICFVIAAILWFFQSMGREYNTQLNVEVSYSNIPDNKTFSEAPPERVRVDVLGMGWDLLAYKFRFSEPKFEVDVTQVPDNFLSARQLILEAVPGLTNIRSITPERIEIKLEEALRVKVPIKSALQVTPSYGFGYVSSILEPDSVELFGTTTALSGIEFVETAPMELNEIEGEQEFSVNLELPKGIVSASASETAIKVLCEPLTEKELEVVIKVVGYNGQQKVNIYPRLATLKLLTTISQFDKIDKNDFEVYVDFTDAKADDDELLEVKVVNNSQWVSSYRLHPKYVDYFLGE